MKASILLRYASHCVNAPRAPVIVALRLSEGALESGEKFLHGGIWKMHVTDEAGATVCRLRFSAEDCD